MEKVEIKKREKVFVLEYKENRNETSIRVSWPACNTPDGTMFFYATDAIPIDLVNEVLLAIRSGISIEMDVGLDSLFSQS